MSHLSRIWAALRVWAALVSECNQVTELPLKDFKAIPTKTTSNSIQFSFAPLGISKALTEDGWISFRFGQESPSGSPLCKSVKRQLGGLPDQRFFGGVLIGIGIFWQMLAQIPWRQWSLSKPTVTNISCDFGLTNSCKVDFPPFWIVILIQLNNDRKFLWKVNSLRAESSCRKC